MKTPFIKILLLGEYSIFRSALRMLLETDKKLRVIGEATHLSAAESIIAEESPDMILVDLPETEGCANLGDFDHSAIPVLVQRGQAAGACPCDSVPFATKPHAGQTTQLRIASPLPRSTVSTFTWWPPA